MLGAALLAPWSTAQAADNFDSDRPVTNYILRVGYDEITAEDPPEASPSDEPEETEPTDAAMAPGCGCNGYGNGCACNNGACNNGCGCNSGCGWCGPDCQDCPSCVTQIGVGLDTFHNPTDSLLFLLPSASNFGVVTSANVGTRLGSLSDYGFGAQLGASYGVYDFNGRYILHPSAAQEQIFVTAGLFRRPDAEIPFGFGVVYDWQINNNYGALAQSPFLGQWRCQFAYASSAWNEFGWWGAFHDRRDTKSLIGIPITYRSINQNNLFWHHKYQRGADSWLYIGLADQNRLNFANLIPNTGSVANWIFGGTVTAPMSDYLAVYANFAYMVPTAPSNILGTAASDEVYQLGAGITYYISGNARTKTVAGQCWAPYMPLANNGNFVVDSSFASVNSAIGGLFP